MASFLYIITSFPTVIFTFLFVFCIFLWAASILGLFDFEVFELDIADVSDASNNINIFAGMLIRLGLQGIPFPLTVSLITVFGWATSYFTCLFLFPLIGAGILKTALGVVILVFSFFSAVFLTKSALTPFRRVFSAANRPQEASIIGKTATVRTSRVDANFGEVNIIRNGAELIIDVRAFDDQVYKNGDKVVLIERVESGGYYKVISEEEFNNSFN